MKEQFPNKKEYSQEEAIKFYQNLLEKALDSIPVEGAVMVLGPMFIIRTPEENFKLFEQAQQQLNSGGMNVFNQLPYVDYNLKQAPFKYDLKFETFYKPLIQSGKITACYVLPDSEQSQGTQSEIEYARHAGVPVINFK